MLYFIIMFSTAVLLIVPSIFLLAGRGAFLIAGYNTASAAEKAAYNEKRLCRIIGAGTLVIGIPILIMAFLGENVSRWFVIVTLVITALDVIAMILLCNSRWVRNAVDTGTAPQPKNKAATLIATGVTAIAMLITAVVLFAGDVRFEYSASALLVNADLWSDLTIRYEDIESVELRDGAIPGSKKTGADGFRLLLGKFQNQEFGTYTRYTYRSCDMHVVLRCKSGVIVLNGADRDSTVALFDTLCQHTGQ